MKTSGKTSKSTGKAAGRPRGSTDRAHKQKDVMTSRPSQDKKNFTSKRNPTGIDSEKGDRYDRDLKQSGKRQARKEK
jgi:hypothetical protein